MSTNVKILSYLHDEQTFLLDVQQLWDFEDRGLGIVCLLGL